MSCTNQLRALAMAQTYLLMTEIPLIEGADVRVTQGQLRLPGLID